jgi:hypothetical protein
LRRFMALLLGQFLRDLFCKILASRAGSQKPRSKSRVRGGAFSKNEARPKGPGAPRYAAAQYMQKTPKNNGLFEIW